MQVMHIKRVSKEVWQKDRGLGMPMNENKGILLPWSTQNKEDQIPGVTSKECHKLSVQPEHGGFTPTVALMSSYQ